MTIRDIATKAGVSVATVSRVLNGQSGYSPDTRDRIMQIVEQTGYSRNDLARSLTGKATHSIGVLLPSLTSYFQSDILWGIETASHARDLSVIICNTDKNGSRTLKYLKTLREKRVDGVIFVSEWLQPEYKSGIESLGAPVVLVSTYSPFFSFPYVKVDDYQASYDAVAYLIDSGHRRIGMLSGAETDLIAGKPRLEGYRAALRYYGIEFDNSRVAYGDFDYRSGRAAMEALLRRAPDTTAVFAASDEMAVGAMQAVYFSGKRVPEDISIIGYDDTLLAEMAHPALTAVHQPIQKIGSTAVEMLNSADDKPAGMILQHSITERDSVLKLN